MSKAMPKGTVLKDRGGNILATTVHQVVPFNRMRVDDFAFPEGAQPLDGKIPPGLIVAILFEMFGTRCCPAAELKPGGRA